MAMFPITDSVRLGLLALVRNGGTATFDQCRHLARRKAFADSWRGPVEYNLVADTGRWTDDRDPAGTRVYQITPAGLMALMTHYYDLAWKTDPPRVGPATAAAQAEASAVQVLAGQMLRDPTWPEKSSTSAPPPSAAAGSSPAPATPRSSRTRTAGGRSRPGAGKTARTSGSTSGSRRK